MRGPVTWPVLFFLLAIVVKQSTQELANPCKIGINKQTFFPNPEDNTKYIQCTTWGQMFISSCPSGQIWKQETLTCMRSSVAELEKSINKAKSKLESSEPIVEQIETVKEAEPIKAEETSQIEAKQPEIVEQIQSSETVGEQLDKIETSHEKIEEQPHVAEIKESQEPQQSIQEVKTAVNDQPSQEGGKTVLLKAKAKNLQLKVAPSSSLDLFKDSYELSHSSDSLASQSNRKQPSAKLLQFQQNMMQPQQQQMMSQMPQQQMMGQQTMMPQQQQQQMMGGQQAMMPQQQGMASMGAGMGAGMGGMGAMGAGMGGMGAGMPGMGAMGGMPGGMPGMGAPGVPPMGGMPPAGPVGGPMVPPMAGAVPPMAGIPPVMPGVMPGMMPGVMPGMFGPGVFGAALAVPMYPALVGGIGFGFGGGRYYDRDRRRGNGRHDHDHDHDHDDDDDDRRHRGRPLSMNSLLKSSDSFVINNCAMVKCATGMVCAVASNCPTCNPMCFPPNDIRFETGVALGCDKVICPNDYHCIVNSTDQKLICLHEAPLTITENDIPSSPLPLESTSSLAPFIVNSCSNVKCSEEMICAAPTNCPTCNPMCFPPNKIQFEFGVHLSCEHIVCPTGFNCAQKADMENKLSCEPIHIATLETTSTTTPSSMIESVSTTTIMPSPVDTLTTTTFATPILTTTTLSPLPVVPSSSSNSFIVNSCNHVLCPLSMVCAVASNCPTCNPMCFPKDRIEFQFGARLSCSSIVCPSDSECGSEDGKLVCRKDQPIQQLIQPKQPVEASTLPVPVSLPLPAAVESSLPETKIQPKPVKSSAESFQVTKCENVLCPDNMVCATATNCLTCTPMCFPRNMIKFEFGKRPSCENVVCPFGFDCIPDSMDSSKLMCQSNDQMMAPMMSTTSTTTMASVVQPTTSTTTTTESTTTTTTTPSTTTTTTPTTTTTTTTSTTSTLPTTTTTSTLPMPSVVSPVANSDSFIVNNCQSVSCGDNLVCATASNCPDCNPMCFPPDKLFFQFGQHLTCRQVKCPTGFDCMVDTTNDKLTCVANKKKTIADVPVESMQQQDEQLVQPPVSAETTTQSTSTTTARPSNVVIVNRCDMVNCGGKHVCATASNCDTCNPMCFPPGKLFFQFGVQVTCDTVKCPSGMSCFVDPADSIVKCRD